ncbi:DUF3515 family protein [Microbacterium hominis]|uniref:DUF3515 family protein n=1 Tax=Microbacterium hominis TaxID=162426 RepID=UPI0020B8B23F|nr:DUF3515 family protein [Microbacterium hominis]
MPRPLRALAVALAFGVIGTALVSCSSSVGGLTPGPLANDPACADVSVRLPDAIGDLDRRWTDAQATGAWGDPAAVLFTCGLEPTGPTTLRCISVGGVDWLVDESEAPRFRLTTYGRTPAAEVYVDNEIVSPNEALDAVASAVLTLPQDAACTEPETPIGESEG